MIINKGQEFNLCVYGEDIVRCVAIYESGEDSSAVHYEPLDSVPYGAYSSPITKEGHVIEIFSE